MNKFLSPMDLVKAPVSDLILQLNIRLQKDGAIFRLVPNLSLGSIDIVPSSSVWLSDVNSIINVSKEYLTYLKSFFASQGYNISFSDGVSCFWLIDTKDISSESAHQEAI